MTRVAAIADIHLGAPGSPGLRWASDALRNAMGQDADLLVIAGDLVDRKHATDAVVEQAVELLRAAIATDVPVLVVWGNHDIAADLPSRLPDDLTDTPGLAIAPGSDAATYRYGSLTVHAQSVATNPDPREVVDGFPVVGDGSDDAAASADGPHLGILHTSLTGEYSRKPCLPTTVAELESRGYDRWLLAHVHRPIAVTDTIGWVGIGRLELIDL
ncbi:MAG TPA: metallophosphoesterase [Candidatus Corynebacterium avicola]|uniref:Metallophosphoesterase n=1 Tax=Candidatus Corynebacterium avicola TaxID=2838527 RepID=A0A9D1RRT3_9CORY|nr:metallophosphoesterase [Candidatus Corynebacterium avicola]